MSQLAPTLHRTGAGSIGPCSPLLHTQLFSQVQALLTTSNSRLGGSTLMTEVPGFPDELTSSILPTCASTKGGLFSDFSLILQLLLSYP